MSIERPIISPSPRISVVIPTIPSNDHEKVVDCLRRQTHNDFDIIIVNDPTLDICEARNRGIEEAAADIVALTDDDCRPESDWITAIEAGFVSNENVICLEGTVHGGMTYDGERRYVGCNLAFDRSAALSVGGFDSAYAGWRDDTEFGWRMEKKGSTRYNPNMVVEHPTKPNSRIDHGLEQRLREQYPEQYREVIEPDGIFERINHVLWMHGFWDAVDKVRYS